MQRSGLTMTVVTSIIPVRLMRSLCRQGCLGYEACSLLLTWKSGDPMEVWLEVTSITQKPPFKLRSIPKAVHAACTPRCGVRDER